MTIRSERKRWGELRLTAAGELEAGADYSDSWMLLKSNPPAVFANGALRFDAYSTDHTWVRVQVSINSQQAALDLDDIWEICGLVVGVRNFRWALSGDRGMRFRLFVDDYSDLVILPPASGLVATLAPAWAGGGSLEDPRLEIQALAAEWRQKGNVQLALADYDSALDCYRQSAILNRWEVAAVANQAEALLRAGDWEGALLAANEALSIDPNHSVAMERKTRALMRMQQFEAALECLGHWTMEENRARRAWEGMCERGLAGQAGEIHWDDKQDLLVDYPETRFDVADFCGPIEVKTVQGRGLGVLATADLKQGELLCVCKPAAIVFSSELVEPRRMVAEDELRDLDGEIVSGLVGQLLSKFPTHRSLHREVLALSKGRFQTESEAQEVTEQETVTEIVASNCLGFRPALSYDPTEWPDLGTDHRGAGLWLLPSRFNHSCTPNCSFRVWGDLMVITANRPVMKGEELCISYLSPFAKPGMSGKERFASWGFECHCERCAKPKPAWPWSQSKTIDFLGQVWETEGTSYVLVEALDRLLRIAKGEGDLAADCLDEAWRISESSPWLADRRPELSALIAYRQIDLAESREEMKWWRSRTTKDMQDAVFPPKCGVVSYCAIEVMDEMWADAFAWDEVASSDDSIV